MIGFYFVAYASSICWIIIHWWEILGLNTVHGRRSLLHLHLLLQEILRRRLRLSITLGALGHPGSRLLVIRILRQGNPGRFLQLHIWAIGIKLLLLQCWWSILLPLPLRTLSLLASRYSHCSGTGCAHQLAWLARWFLDIIEWQGAMTASCLDFAAYFIPGALLYALSSGLIHLFEFFKILLLSGWFIIEFGLLNRRPLACLVHRRHHLRHWHKLRSIIPLTFLQSGKALER